MVGHEVRRQSQLMSQVVGGSVPVGERLGDQQPMRIPERSVQPRFPEYSLINH